MKKYRFIPWLYSAPAFILVGLIVIFPIAYTCCIAFTNMNMYHWDDYQWIGLDNFIRALTKVNSGFLGAIMTTVIWTIINMLIQIIISFFIALGLNAKGLKMARVYKTLLMFPWAMPAYVSILLWKVGIFNTEFGLINKLFLALGFSRKDFLSHNFSAFISCLVLNLWMALPFMIMMMDGALQSIDRSYHESAKLDGAGFWKLHWHVTAPLIRPVMAPAVIMTTFTTFKQFDIVYLLTMQKGAHSGSNIQTIITYAYSNAFVSNNYGLSCAVSLVIFGFIILFSSFMNRKAETA